MRPPGRGLRRAAARAVLALGLLAGRAAPAGAGVPAWLREEALPRLGAGVELGTAVPVDPFDFSAGWEDGRGGGAFATVALTPTVDVLLRAERDRFAFRGEGFRASWTALENMTGGDATLESLSLGLRVHHRRGAVRAHAALYGGLTRRIARRATTTYTSPRYTVTWGEPDATVQSYGFGVGATWAVPRLPDLTVEARVLWFGEGGDMWMPLRVGVVLP
jgi:hypothetical protein